MRKLKYAAIGLVAVLIFGLAVYGAVCIKEIYDTRNYTIMVMQKEAELTYDSYKCALVGEVNEYIDSVAPTSALSGYAIVTQCEQYDLDIKFVLAQGELESRFGTNGLATKTNSVFNVGAFDGKKVGEIHNRWKYPHPDHSIEPYIHLLYRDYIVNGKTELDLLGKFVSKKGLRYSTNPHYENDLIRLYKKIDKTTQITHLQGEMRRYKIICGK